MTKQTGRNVEQPEFLNEKNAAEDRQGKATEETPSEPDKERKEERIIDSAISQTVRH